MTDYDVILRYSSAEDSLSFVLETDNVDHDKSIISIEATNGVIELKKYLLIFDTVAKVVREIHVA